MSYKIFVNGLATSKKLDEIQEELPDENISLKELINVMSGEGLQFMIIILIAPFLIPASIPGSSTPFGILIILLEIAYLNNKSLYIPDFIGKYEISKENVLKLFDIIKKALGYVEKISNPRGKLSSKKYVLKINAVVNIILAFLLFLPLPIPFTDFIPATSMLLLAVSTLEHDSYLMILGYVAAILTVIYFSSVGYVGIEIIRLTLNYIGIPI
ncbi:exopolysaccharide biosynthesis protein [Methanosphaera sp.]|uniref:exopolysaccharide biosynthesis protein n=1 Tax=Methanosphaera sp. TaxID=2666342 RepID=UPI002E792B6D|nr:exopolysaccharide biosynthesis protein [Methanosphaera sp.]MEE1117066.1 exopolysaccharide biosynthesis protein [Methanosphaera sp.]